MKLGTDVEITVPLILVIRLRESSQDWKIEPNYTIEWLVHVLSEVCKASFVSDLERYFKGTK